MAWTFYNSSGEALIKDGGISNVVEDTTPQLGGNLDMQARLLVGNGGSTGIAISAAGEVTMAAQPGFHSPGTGTASNVTGDGTDYTMVFAGTERFDQNADFDNTSTFTAPVAGNYLFTGHVSFSGLSSMESLQVMLEVGGSSILFGWVFDGTTIGADSVHGTLRVPYTFFINLSASDAVTIQVDVAGGAQTAEVELASSYFSGYLVQ